jgi:hypothetical protein
MTSPDNSATRSLQTCAALLTVLSGELDTLAREISRIGGILSEEALRVKNPSMIREIQAFDVIAQRAVSHAALLRQVVGELSAPAHGAGSGLKEIIDAIPFHEVRRRLIAALEGECTEGSGAEEGRGHVHWL